MKTLMLALVAATALSAGAASAQTWGDDGPYDGRGYDGQRHYGERPHLSIDRRQAMLERRIERGVETGRLTRREAWEARSQFRDIQRMEDRYESDGWLTAWERADLDRRLDALAMQLRADMHDSDRYGYNDYRPY